MGDQASTDDPAVAVWTESPERDVLSALSGGRARQSAGGNPGGVKPVDGDDEEDM